MRHLGKTELIWWAIGMAHEHRDLSMRAARRGDFAEAGRHYGSALGCYDAADQWTRDMSLIVSLQRRVDT